MSENNRVLTTADSGINIEAMRDLTYADNDPGQTEEVKEETESEEVTEPEDDSDGDVEPQEDGDELDDSTDEDDSDGDVEPQDDDTSEDDEPDPDSYFVGELDGEEVQIPKDAMIEITVNGKKELISVQDAANRASGDIHLGRELSKLGRERKDFERERQEFQETRDDIQSNLDDLFDVATNGDPMDFVEYLAQIKRKEPIDVMNEMAGQVVEWLNKYKNMSENERDLYLKVRKAEYNEKKRERESRKREADEASKSENRKIAEALEDAGITDEQFEKAIQEIQDRDADPDDPFELDSRQQIDAYTIIDYIEQMDRVNRVASALEKIDPKLLKDEEYIKKTLLAVTHSERFNQSKLTEDEIAELIGKQRSLKDKSTSESLSRKAKRHKKSGATSKNASSQKPKKKDDSEFYGLDAHRAKLYGS